MKKFLVYALALCVTLFLTACGTTDGENSQSAQEESSASTTGSSQLQEPQDAPEPERSFRIDTRKDTHWYKGDSIGQTQSCRYEYDEDGHLLQITPIEGGEYVTLYYEYDEAGNLIRESTLSFGSDGAVHSRSTHEYTYTEVTP